ncbi:MAG: 2OG-Fe(II) oxygenase [Polyangiaceae bacterium]
MIRLGETACIVEENEAVLGALSEEFGARHALILRGFLEGAFLSKLQASLRASMFEPKSHEGVGTELVSWDSPAADALMFVMNDPRLFSVIRRIAGLGEIGCFVGRLYRMTAGESHHDDWHDDAGDHRLVALSINLSEEPYRGGTTLLREKGAPATTRVLENTTPGDALLFRVDPALEHRITDVEPGPPKTAWAGWFRSEPSFRDILSGKARI